MGVQDLVAKGIANGGETHIREEGEGVDGLVRGHGCAEVKLQIDHVVGEIDKHQWEEEKLHQPSEEMVLESLRIGAGQ